MERKLLGRVRVLCIVLCFLVFPQLSCSKSNPVSTEESLTDDGSGGTLLREMKWLDSDRPVANTDEAERRVDVSNVVMGRSYMIYDPVDIANSTNHLRGYILSHDYDIDQDPQVTTTGEELVVTAWAQRNEMSYDGGTYVYWDVYFQVYGEDEDHNPIESDNFIVENPTWDPGPGEIPGSQNYPSVTAHIGDSDPDNWDFDDPVLYIDIAFQRREIYGDDNRWMVYHAQYSAPFGDYDSFELVGDEINRIAPSEGQENTFHAVHPDIVYGTYWGGVDGLYNIFDIDYLVAVYELVRISTGIADIAIAENIPSDGTPIEWNQCYEKMYTGYDDDHIPQYPRVDMGIDCMAHFQPTQAAYYIAAVVFHVLDFTDPQYITATLYYNFKVYNVPFAFIQWPVEFDSFTTENCPNGLPYVEIDPIENWLTDHRRTLSHMVWSRFNDQYGNDIEPWYTNSLEVLWNFFGDKIHPVFDSGSGYREGLVTIATYSDQTDVNPYDRVGTIQFVSAWYEDTEYPVYSVDFHYDNGYPEFPIMQYAGSVSHEDNPSSDVFPWDCGPASAMLGGDITVCGWTKRDDLGGGSILYDIYSDDDL